MKSSVRPKNKIMFPNAWAANSFLNRLKRSAGWEYLASSDNAHVKVKPKGAADYILIGLNKSRECGYLEIELNAEKLGPGADGYWDEIFNHARRYRS
jgi:hypothetical protein